MEYTLRGDENAHRFTLTNGLKDLRYLEAMADDAGMANGMGNAAKNLFALAVSAGGDTPDSYVPMLPRFVGALNGTDLAPGRDT